MSFCIEIPAIDVHLAVSPKTPIAWVNQCIDSINMAIAAAEFPVHLHIVAAVEGHVGKARAMGYACGNAPYVTHLDDDDWIEPNSFIVIGQALKTLPDAIFPMELRHEGNTTYLGHQRHAFVVFKRELLIDHASRELTSDARQNQQLMLQADCIDIPDPLYHYRIYSSPARELRRAIHR